MTDGEIRANPALTGRVAYEASLQIAPTYHDGTARPTWDELSSLARWTWERPLKSNTNPGQPLSPSTGR